jgi:hypothetical protein
MAVETSNAIVIGRRHGRLYDPAQPARIGDLEFVAVEEHPEDERLGDHGADQGRVRVAAPLALREPFGDVALRAPGQSAISPARATAPDRIRGGLGTIVGATFLGMGIACLETPTFEDLE